MAAVLAHVHLRRPQPARLRLCFRVLALHLTRITTATAFFVSGRRTGFRAVFHVARISTAAAVLMGRRGVVLRAVIFHHLTRIAAAATATGFVSGRGVILHPVLFHHLTRITAAATATGFVSRRRVILRAVFFHHLTRITGGHAATRVFIVNGGLVCALRERNAGNGDC